MTETSDRWYGVPNRVIAKRVAGVALLLLTNLVLLVLIVVGWGASLGYLVNEHRLLERDPVWLLVAGGGSFLLAILLAWFPTAWLKKRIRARWADATWLWTIYRPTQDGLAIRGFLSSRQIPWTRFRSVQTGEGEAGCTFVYENEDGIEAILRIPGSLPEAEQLEGVCLRNTPELRKNASETG